MPSKLQFFVVKATSFNKLRKWEDTSENLKVEARSLEEVGTLSKGNESDPEKKENIS